MSRWGIFLGVFGVLVFVAWLHSTGMLERIFAGLRGAASPSKDPSGGSRAYDRSKSAGGVS